MTLEELNTKVENMTFLLNETLDNYYSAMRNVIESEDLLRRRLDIQSDRIDMHTKSIDRIIDIANSMTDRTIMLTREIDITNGNLSNLQNRIKDLDKEVECLAERVYDLEVENAGN